MMSGLVGSSGVMKSANGDVLQVGAIVVAVEGRPAAVIALHADDPGVSPARWPPSSPAAALSESWDQVQGPSHQRRVIDVRVPTVLELERPATRVLTRRPSAPSAAQSPGRRVSLPSSHSRRLDERRMRRRQPRAPQGDDRPCGVPDHPKRKAAAACCRRPPRRKAPGRRCRSRLRGRRRAGRGFSGRRWRRNPGQHDAAPTAVGVLAVAEPALDASQRQATASA